MTTPENTCSLVHQCVGACCHDSVLGMTTEKFQLFREAIPLEVPTEQLSFENVLSLTALRGIGSKETIIFYANNEHRRNTEEAEIVVYIRNACPHLNPGTSDCGLFGKPFRPPACTNLPIGSKRCNNSRGQLGLPQIK